MSESTRRLLIISILLKTLWMWSASAIAKRYSKLQKVCSLNLAMSPGIETVGIGPNHTGKCIRRFGGIYAYYRYFKDRKW